MEERKNPERKEHNVIGWFAGIPRGTKLIILCVLALVLIIAFPVVCNRLGTGVGGAVGTAVGSFKAVTEDIPKGYAAGKAVGLSAEDTHAVIGNGVRRIGRLEVLAANTSLADFHKDGEKYAALYLVSADVVFSVDVTKARILFSEQNDIDLILPEPEAAVYIDQNKTDLVAQWQKNFFSGSTEDGMTAYLNSMTKIQQATAESLDGYDALLEQAKKSAEKQIGFLMKSIAPDIGPDRIHIHFE